MADLSIIGSVPILISLHGTVVPAVIGINIAVVGSVPIKVAPVGIIALATPGVEAVVGSVALQVGPDGTIDFGVSTAVIGSVGIRVRPAGVVSTISSINAYVGSVKLGIGIAGVVRSAGPIVLPVLALVGSVGVIVSPDGVISELAPSISAYVGSVNLRIGVRGTVGGAFPTALPVLATIGSIKLGIGVKGVIGGALPIALPVLAIIGSVGTWINVKGVVGAVVPSTLSVFGSVNLRIGIKGVTGGAFLVAPPVLATIGFVNLRIGVKGVVRSAGPITLPALATIGSVGIGINVKGVVGAVVPSTLSVFGSVNIRIGEFRVPELTVVQLLSPADLTLAAITGSVGVEVGPAGVITLSTPPSIYAVPTPRAIEGATINIRVAGVIAFIHPQILEVIGAIEVDVGVGGGSVDPGVFDTYALTGIRGEPSIYSNFPFNSYASYRGQDFGAGPGGIYLLEGEDDAGAEIHAGIRLGPFNFGTDKEKRLRLLRLGGKTTGALVKVSNGNGSAGYYDVEGGRAGVSREVQGREITVDITDFESLDHLEIVPLILIKR